MESGNKQFNQVLKGEASAAPAISNSDKMDPTDIACEFSLRMCQYFLIMPGRTKKIESLLQLAASLTTVPELATSTIRQRINGALMLIYEEIDMNAADTSGSKAQTNASAFENLLKDFWISRKDGVDNWPLKDLGLEADGVERGGTWVLNQFIEEFEKLTLIHGSKMDVEADLADLAQWDKKIKVYDALVQHLNKFYCARGFGRSESERLLLRPELEKKIQQMWKSNQFDSLVSPRTEVKWKLELGSSTALDSIERTTGSIINPIINIPEGADATDNTGRAQGTGMNIINIPEGADATTDNTGRAQGTGMNIIDIPEGADATTDNTGRAQGTGMNIINIPEGADATTDNTGRAQGTGMNIIDIPEGADATTDNTGRAEGTGEKTINISEGADATERAQVTGCCWNH